VHNRTGLKTSGLQIRVAGESIPEKIYLHTGRLIFGYSFQANCEGTGLLPVALSGGLGSRGRLLFRLPRFLASDASPRAGGRKVQGSVSGVHQRKQLSPMPHLHKDWAHSSRLASFGRAEPQWLLRGVAVMVVRAGASPLSLAICSQYTGSRMCGFASRIIFISICAIPANVGPERAALWVRAVGGSVHTPKLQPSRVG
jgi:hypothetical protein